MDLFIRPNVTFEKVAAETTLPEDPNAWPHEVLQELYKQVPYVADFTPHVNMDKVDGERGYGFGHVEVTSDTEIQSGEASGNLAAAGVKQVRIPVIIKNNKLQAYDLLITADSKVLPLTEARLRSALFRPQVFDVTGRTPGDQSMIGQLYPPYRQNSGFGSGGISTSMDMGKAASAFEEYLQTEGEKHGRLGKKMATVDAEPGALDAFIAKHASAKWDGSSSLLEAILPTITETDQGGFRRFVEDRETQALMHKNAAAVYPSTALILGHRPDSVEKTASVIDRFLRPTVTQVSRGDGEYIVKSASHLYWSPKEETLSRGDAIKQYGSKVVMAADLSGSSTSVEGATVDADLEQGTDLGSIEETGVYQVMTEEGQPMVGSVIVGLIDVSGDTTPLSLFVGENGTAVQTDIVGSPAEGSFGLPSGPMQGTGVFFNPEDPSSVTIPLTLKGSYSAPGENEPATYQAETFDGAPVEVSVQPNIQHVTAVPGAGGGAKMLIPDSWAWSPTGALQAVALKSEEATTPVEGDKQACVSVSSSNGETFSFSGEPVEKLSHYDREFLGLDDAMFLLSGFGVEPEYGAKKLAQAVLGGRVTVPIGREISTSEERKEAAIASAENILAESEGLKRVLWKEAATISDPTAVDTVLSLGFINPENVTTFVGYLPCIEECQLKLCDLLLAARLGQSDIPEGALEKSIRSQEEVLEGLKALAFKTN